ncbi:mediator complex subunit 19 [Dermatophagoides pteronyssinus]|uniref:Mediator of RNA polymerase II transcription subunit 19 n=1 Tax=Dermatophagoides pteronyssinus TaxID=6956 RepID=A0A6P6XWT5_DERPT|nr:mediator of RNA polymerase II transcription subunit 19-like [Dermatophagoides pteronyssinus]
MMSEIVRRPSEQCSPKTSPRGNRSPVVIPRQDSTGTLKTTISLGKTPAIVHSGPFYLMKELPPPSELTGSTNLLQYHNLEHSFNKFCGRKIKDQLSAFLPNLPGNIDIPGSQDDSSLRKMIERPPITSIEIVPLNKQQLDSAFRLHVGPVPDQYRFMSQTVQRKKHKHKKSHKNRSGPNGPCDSPIGGPNDHHSSHLLSDSNINSDLLSSLSSNRDSHEMMMKKHKKQKRHDDEKEQRRKKKKDKKKKKRHSPDSPPYDPNTSLLPIDDSPMMSSSVPSSVMIGGGPGTPSNPTSNNGLNSTSSNHQSSNTSIIAPQPPTSSSSITTMQHSSSSSLNNNINGSSSGRPLL